MNTENLPTVGEIITTTLERVEELTAAAARQTADRYIELQGPRDHALLEAIKDLLDIGDVYSAGRAERVEAAHALLAEFSEKARAYSVLYRETVDEIQLASIYLDIAARPGDCDFIADIRNVARAYGLREPV